MHKTMYEHNMRMWICAECAWTGNVADYVQSVHGLGMRLAMCRVCMDWE